MEKFSLVTLILLITLFSCQNEKPLVLDKGKILNDFHSKNIGKIAFMGDFIPYDNFSEKDFVNEIALTESGDFILECF